MKPFRFPFTAMGSPCELHLYAADVGMAEMAADLAMQEVRRLEARYSRYRNDSITSCINRCAGLAGGIEVDEETAALLDYAQTAWQQSEGLFDITAGVLRRVWNFKTPRVPEQSEIDALLPMIGWWRLHWQRPQLVLPIAEMELDFGGYVKEFAVDRAARLCRDLDIRHGLVDLGGDIAVIGPHPDGTPWQIGIRNPRQPDRAVATIALHRGGLASSGDYERCFEIDGLRYCHILNPFTGWPIRGLSSASVVADDCLVAGTASTIAMLKGLEGVDWLQELGLKHLCIYDDGGLCGSLRSTSALHLPGPQTPAPAPRPRLRVPVSP